MALRAMGIDEFDGFQVDDSNQLHWRGDSRTRTETKA